MTKLKTPPSSLKTQRTTKTPSSDRRGRGALATTETCTNCKKQGHNRDGCWFLYPYLRPAKKKGNDSAIEAVRFQRRDDEERRGYTAVAEAKPSLAIKRGESGPLAIAGPNTNAHTSSLVTPQIQDQLGLLISQVNSLLSAQAQQKGLKSVFLSQINLDNNTWIIDSGATNHMTNYKSHLLNLKTYDTSQYVSVANGTKIPIQGQGTVKIFDRNISNVLYIPGLTTNLLSVQKLIQDLNCNVIFHSNRVVFQDKITGKKIGEGLERNELYVINYPNHAL
jgi:hypothetical protein